MILTNTSSTAQAVAEVSKIGNLYSSGLELRMPRSFPIFFTQKIEPYSFQGGLGGNLEWLAGIF